MNIIVACDINNGIGYKNTIPWHCSEDLKLFKKKTDNHVVIMGNNTFKSIGKPLINRVNIVLTRQKELPPSTHECSVNGETSCFYTNSITQAIQWGESYKDKIIWVIGGASIYEQFLDLDIVDEVHMTRILGQYKTDTYFPVLNSYKWGSISYSSDTIYNNIRFTISKRIRWYNAQ